MIREDFLEEASKGWEGCPRMLLSGEKHLNVSGCRGGQGQVLCCIMWAYVSKS